MTTSSVVLAQSGAAGLTGSGLDYKDVVKDVVTNKGSLVARLCTGVLAESGPACDFLYGPARIRESLRWVHKDSASYV